MSPPPLAVFTGALWVPVSGSGSTAPEPLPPPGVPGSLTVSMITTTTAVVSWSAPTPPAAYFEVYLDGDLKGSVTGTVAPLSGLSAGTEHEVAVRGVNPGSSPGPLAVTTFETLTPGPSDWPDASNTGYQGSLAPPVNLTSLRDTFADGVVIENRHIICNGAAVSPRFPGVLTFKNCLFEDGGTFRMIENVDSPPTHILVEDCEFISSRTTLDEAINAGANMTIRRCNVHCGKDGIKAGWDVLVEDCYIHDMDNTGDDPHNDGIQCLGTDNLIIRHNTIWMPDGATSCVILSTGSAPEMKNVLIENNLLRGGAYCVYGGYQAGADNPDKIGNIQIINNKVSTDLFPEGGSYGPFASVDSPVVVSGNTWFDGPNAGQPINV